MPDFQEYHGLRRVRDAKVLCNRLPDDPDDTVPGVDNERDRIPVFPPDLPIHQKILQLAAAGGPKRPEPVTGPTASDRQRQGERPGGDADFRPPRRPFLSLTDLGRRRPLLVKDPFSRHRLATDLDLTRNRQRNRERGPTPVRLRRFAATAGQKFLLRKNFWRRGRDSNPWSP